MTRFTVTSPTGLSVPPMMPIKLSAKQLALRAHQVKPLAGSDFHQSTEALSFKRGEVVEVEGELPKTLAQLTDQPVVEAPAAAEETSPRRGRR